MKETDMITPVIGMGVTECMYSDRHANTIIKISGTGKTIWIQRDKAIRTDKFGKSEIQKYKYEMDQNGIVQKCTQRRDGTFRTLGENGSTIILGQRDEYFDYSL